MLSIVELSPRRGPVGTAVKIFGAEFDPVPSLNKVTFSRASRKSGVSAVVISSSPTVLVTKVPAGASTGPVTVATPAGSATSASVFTVESAPATQRAPTILGFAPVVAAPGTEVTIQGASFDTSVANDRVLFGGARAAVKSATTTELVTAVPDDAASGPIVVVTPAGTASSSRDFFVPPTPYTAADVAFMGRVTVGGSARAVILTRPLAFALSLCALILFDGTAGQQLRLTLTELAIPESDVAVYRPDAAALVAPAFVRGGGASAVIELPALPLSGTYTVLVDPRGAHTGSVTLRLARG